MRFFVFIIIYNKECAGSDSCESIPFDKDAEVSIFDNSDTANDVSAEYCKNKNWHYEWMGGNIGLSKAYNHAVEQVCGEDGILVWFDDDTKISNDYFIRLRETERSGQPASIFLPVVTNNGRILSPSKIHGHNSQQVSDISVLDQQTITGINSGMAIKTEVFRNYRYDERLFLDCIDHQFIKDMKRRGFRIAVFDARLEQKYSQTDASLTLQSVHRRMLLFDKDFRQYCSDTLSGRFYYRINYLLRRVRYAQKWLRKSQSQQQQ